MENRSISVSDLGAHREDIRVVILCNARGICSSATLSMGDAVASDGRKDGKLVMGDERWRVRLEEPAILVLIPSRVSRMSRRCDEYVVLGGNSTSCKMMSLSLPVMSSESLGRGFPCRGHCVIVDFGGSLGVGCKFGPGAISSIKRRLCR